MNNNDDYERILCGICGKPIESNNSDGDGLYIDGKADIVFISRVIMGFYANDNYIDVDDCEHDINRDWFHGACLDAAIKNFKQLEPVKTVEPNPMLLDLHGLSISWKEIAEHENWDLVGAIKYSRDLTLPYPIRKIWDRIHQMFEVLARYEIIDETHEPRPCETCPCDKCPLNIPIHLTPCDDPCEAYESWIERGVKKPVPGEQPRNGVKNGKEP